MAGPVRFSTAHPPVARLSAASATRSDSASSWWNRMLPATTRIQSTTASNPQPRIGIGFATTGPAFHARRNRYAEKNGTGRDHNPGGFTVWLAGGGVKRGFAYGQTDEFGHLAVEEKVHMHDLHATILRLLGLDHERLTFHYTGRPFRLTDVHGRVVQEIIA